MTEWICYTVNFWLHTPPSLNDLNTHNCRTLNHHKETIKGERDGENGKKAFKDGKMQIVDLELEKHVEKHVEIKTPTSNTKLLSHSIEEILKKPSSQTVLHDKTEQRSVHKTSGFTQTKLRAEDTKISQCTGMR